MRFGMPTGHHCLANPDALLCLPSSLQLLSDPLSTERIAWLVAWLDVLSLPFSALAPVPLTAASEQRCHAFLFFLQLVFGVRLPLVVLARTQWQRPPAVPPPAPLPTGEVPSKRLLCRLERAAATVNRAVWRCSSFPASGAAGVVWWVGLSLAWTATLYLHGL